MASCVFVVFVEQSLPLDCYTSVGLALSVSIDFMIILTYFKGNRMSANFGSATLGRPTSRFMGNVLYARWMIETFIGCFH